MSDDLRYQFYLKLPGAEEIVPSLLRIPIPIKRWDRDIRSYQAEAFFPHVLPGGWFSARHPSNFVALKALMSSIRTFCVDFEKEGGVIYFSDLYDESIPVLNERLKSKPFFSL